METNKTLQISRTRDAVIKYGLHFRKKGGYKLGQNLWRKRSLAIILVLIFTVFNCIITAHYLTRFSFEFKNNIFYYLGFIILSFLGITIINAKWIKIVAEKYADRF